LALKEPSLAPPAPFKVFSAAAFLGDSAWAVVNVLEEDSDGYIKFFCPASYIEGGSGETISANLDKRPVTTALCDTLNLGKELPSPYTPWHLRIGDVVAVDESNHGSYVGVRSYRSNP
jgi:hypothetical protein